LNAPNYYSELDETFTRTANAIKNKLGLRTLNLDIVNHCMNLQDPGHGTLKCHFGGHYDTLKYYVENPSNRDMMTRHLERLKRVIVEFTQKHAHEPRKPVLRIATVCKRGRHQSVILATYLQWCLRHANFDEVTITHVNSDEWDNLCTTCTKCGPCSWLKTPLKNEVIALWDSL
jgi:RNase adaptor protein for sRNA GlmZ degradation